MRGWPLFVRRMVWAQLPVLVSVAFSVRFLRVAAASCGGSSREVWTTLLDSDRRRVEMRFQRRPPVLVRRGEQALAAGVFFASLPATRGGGRHRTWVHFEAGSHPSGRSSRIPESPWGLIGLAIGLYNMAQAERITETRPC